MKFSIIIPVYNTLQYLPECLNSVLNQSYRDFEIILIDDGSQDACSALCDEYAQTFDSIRVIHTPNRGVASARNTGIQTACGDYLCFVDSDDTISPYTLETLSDSIGDADVMLFGMIYKLVEDWKRPNGYDVVVANSIKHNEIVCETIYQQISRRKREAALNCRTACGTLYKRKLVIDLNAQFALGVKLGEDTCFNIAIFPHCHSIRYINEYLYCVHTHSDSATAGYMKNAFDSCAPTFDIFKRAINQIPPQTSNASQNFRQYCLKLHACRMVSILKNCLVIDYCHKRNPKPFPVRKSEYLTALNSPLAQTLLLQCDLTLLTNYDTYLFSTFSLPFWELNLIMRNRYIRLFGYACYRIFKRKSR